MAQESSDISIQCPKCGAPLTLLDAGDTVSLRGPAELIDGVLQARIPQALAEVLGPAQADLRPDGEFLSLTLPSDPGYAAGDIVEVSNRAGAVNFWRPVERALEPADAEGRWREVARTPAPRWAEWCCANGHDVPTELHEADSSRGMPRSVMVATYEDDDSAPG